MLPGDFKAVVAQIIKDYGDDPEVCHVHLDNFLESLLIELGYGEGIELIGGTKRWYA